MARPSSPATTLLWHRYVLPIYGPPVLEYAIAIIIVYNNQRKQKKKRRVCSFCVLCHRARPVVVRFCGGVEEVGEEGDNNILRVTN